MLRPSIFMILYEPNRILLCIVAQELS